VSRALHVEAWGDPESPRVVYLHGVTGRGLLARRLAEDWLSDYRVIAPDLLGHGASPYEPPWSIREHVDLVIASVGRQPAVWIGHSFGGRLAYEVAAREPSLVERLVLLDPAMLVDPGISLQLAERARSDRSYASFEEGLDRRFAESFLHDAARDLVADDLRGFLLADEDGRWRYRYSQAAVVAAYGEVAVAPPPFEAVRIPTLLARGRESHVDYDHLLAAHQAALGGLLQLITVPGGHTVLWDALEETGAAVFSFLRG